MNREPPHAEDAASQRQYHGFPHTREPEDERMRPSHSGLPDDPAT